MRRSPVPLGAATASTILLRAADVLAVVAIAAALGPGLAEDLVGGAGIPLAVLSALALVGAAAWLARAVRRLGALARVAGAGAAGRGRRLAARERPGLDLRRLGRASTSPRATPPWSPP